MRNKFPLSTPKTIAYTLSSKITFLCWFILFYFTHVVQIILPLDTKQSFECRKPIIIF